MAPWAKRPWEGKKTGPNPTDRSKLGSKRSLLTEAAGVPLALVCAAANTNDHRLLESTLWGLIVPPPADKGGLCLDKGYDYPVTKQLARQHGLRLHMRTRKEEIRQKKRGYKARRWVVERSHSWSNRFRSLLTRWAKKCANYEAFGHLAFAVLIFKQSGLFG